jgi:hypothetical protein
MNWKFSRTTLSLLRFWPDVLSSHWSNFRRPSTNSGRPFEQYLAMTSPCLPQASMSTNAVSSRVCPLSSFQDRLIASPNCQIAVPFGVTRISGSRVRLPIR